MISTQLGKIIGTCSKTSFHYNSKNCLFTGDHMFKYSLALVLFVSLSSCAHFAHLSQEHNQSDSTDVNYLPKPYQSDLIVDLKTLVRIPKVGDTWKYKCFKNYGGESLKYVSVTVAEMIDIIPFVESDKSDYYGCPAYRTTQIFRDGTKSVLSKLSKMLYSKSFQYQNSIEVHDVSDDQSDLSSSKTVYVLPITMGFNCMNRLYSPLTGIITEMIEVTKYYDSVKVAAGTFYHVWEIHNIQRHDTYVEILSDDFMFYVNDIGMIKQFRKIEGETVPILELISYKLKK